MWINGHLLGHRPSGYASFEYDLTPYVNFGASANVVAVRVDHSAAADSRFYTGSGIYRHVWLTVTEPVHVVRWGTFVHTPMVREADALVTAETGVANESKAAAQIRLVTAIEDASGREVASVATEAAIAPGAVHTFAQQGTVAKPRLWSTEDPYLYTAVTRVFAGGTQVDEYRTPFGIRTIRFDANRGFFLNGKPEKLKGVCLHHDLGALGAAFSEAALERRLKAAEGDRRQCHSLFAQPHGAGVVRPVRPAGAAGDGRGLRRVDGRQEEVDSKDGTWAFRARAVTTKCSRNGPYAISRTWCCATAAMHRW